MIQSKKPCRRVSISAPLARRPVEGMEKETTMRKLIIHEFATLDGIIQHIYPLALGRGKRVFPATGIDRRFTLAKVTPYPTGVVGLHYKRAA
jgi:hypothetical protein